MMVSYLGPVEFMKKDEKKIKQKLFERRRRRTRAVVRGTAVRPRLSVFRSLSHLSAQLIDDTSGRTLLSLRTKALSGTTAVAGGRRAKVADGYRLGFALAERAKTQGIKSVVFDRAGYRYHGRVAAVAEGARDGGLLL